MADMWSYCLTANFRCYHIVSDSSWQSLGILEHAAGFALAF